MVLILPTSSVYCRAKYRRTSSGIQCGSEMLRVTIAVFGARLKPLAQVPPSHQEQGHAGGIRHHFEIHML